MDMISKAAKQFIERTDMQHVTYACDFRATIPHQICPDMHIILWRQRNCDKLTSRWHLTIESNASGGALRSFYRWEFKRWT